MAQPFSADEFFDDFMNDSLVLQLQALEQAQAECEAEEEWEQAKRDAVEEQQFQAIL